MAVDQDQFRALALAWPDTEEGCHHGNADFRCAGRVFATMHADGATGMVKVPPGVQDRLVAGGDEFWPASGAWGRAGCTLVSLQAVSRSVLRDAMAAAWEFAAALAAQKKAQKRTGKPAGKPAGKTAGKTAEKPAQKIAKKSAKK